MARAGDAVARLALALAPHARRIARLRRSGQQRRRRHRGRDPPARLRQATQRCVLVGDPPALPADAGAGASLAPALAGVPISPVSTRASDRRRRRPRHRRPARHRRVARRPRATLAAAIDASPPLAGRGVPRARDRRPVRPGRRSRPAARRRLRRRRRTRWRCIGAEAGPLHRRRAGPRRAGLVRRARRRPRRRGAPTPGWSAPRRSPVRGRARRHAQHKGSFGDVAVVGGAAGMTGAALLAARAAHAAGAGRVFVDLLATPAPPRARARSRCGPS